MSKIAVRSLVEMLYKPDKWDGKAKEIWAGSKYNPQYGDKNEAQRFREDLELRTKQFRDASEKAVHKFDISIPVLENLFTASLTKAGIIGGNSMLSKRVLEQHPDLIRKLATYFQEGMIESTITMQKNRSSAKMTVILAPDGSAIEIIIGTEDSTTNNFDAISRLINLTADYSGKGSGHNAAYRKFIADVVGGLDYSSNHEGDQTSTYVDKDLHDKVLSALEKNNVGLDRGHKDESSNISAAVRALIFNKVKTVSARDKGLLPETQAVLAADIEKVKQGLLQYIQAPSFAKSLTTFLFNDPKVVENVLETTLGYLREMAAGNVTAKLKVDTNTIEGNIQQIARSVAVGIIPQDDSDNRSIGGKIEGVVAAHLRAANNKLGVNIGRLLYLYMTEEATFPGAPLFKDLGGSPSIKDMSVTYFDTALRMGKLQGARYETTATKKASGTVKINIPKATTSKKPLPKLPKVPVPNVNKIPTRGPGGKFVSLINVVNLINLRLAEQLRKNMGSPRLNYRTGRFAQSARVLGATLDKDGVIRMPYTYQKFPYQTFEVGFQKGTPARDPRPLISGTIRELAIKEVTAKLRIVRV